MPSLRSFGSRTFGLHLGREEDHDHGESSRSLDNEFSARSRVPSRKSYEGSNMGVRSTSSFGESLGGSLSISRMQFYRSTSLTQSPSDHTLGSQRPFERFVEHQLERVKEQFESNRSRAVGKISIGERFDCFLSPMDLTVPVFIRWERWNTRRNFARCGAAAKETAGYPSPSRGTGEKWTGRSIGEAL